MPSMPLSWSTYCWSAVWFAPVVASPCSNSAMMKIGADSPGATSVPASSAPWRVSLSLSNWRSAPLPNSSDSAGTAISSSSAAAPVA